jgi:microcystin-dependent protein
MSTPYIGEIRMFGGNFAPRGHAHCQGQLLSIAQNTALFALIGTIYGGDGQVTFALPDLRGRIPVCYGQGPGLSNYAIGQASGTESVTLLPTQLPAHTHTAACNSGAGNSTTPANNFWAANANTGLPQYVAAQNTPMAATALATAGGNQPHNNLMPILAITFIIALEGIFPSRN